MPRTGRERKTGGRRVGNQARYPSPSPPPPPHHPGGGRLRRHPDSTWAALATPRDPRRGHRHPMASKGYAASSDGGAVCAGATGADGTTPTVKRSYGARLHRRDGLRRRHSSGRRHPTVEMDCAGATGLNAEFFGGRADYDGAAGATSVPVGFPCDQQALVSALKALRRRGGSRMRCVTRPRNERTLRTAPIGMGGK